MTPQLSTLAAETTESPARFLAVVQREFHAEIVTPAPGLLAAIDQHAAAVRDVLGPGVGLLAAGDLAAYARGLVEVAVEQDWDTVQPQTQHWLTLRLASVCMLAHRFGYVPDLTAV